MGMNREIGWSDKEILLYKIYRKLSQVSSLSYKFRALSNELSIPMDATYLYGYGLSSENIDTRLIYLAGIPTLNTTIDIRGNSPRTIASDAAVVTLTLNGCQILEDL